MPTVQSSPVPAMMTAEMAASFGSPGSRERRLQRAEDRGARRPRLYRAQRLVKGRGRGRSRPLRHKLALVLAFLGGVRPERPDSKRDLRVHPARGIRHRGFHRVDLAVLAKLGAHLRRGVENKIALLSAAAQPGADKHSRVPQSEAPSIVRIAVSLPRFCLSAPKRGEPI